jgi:hypothetical protein
MLLTDISHRHIVPLAVPDRHTKDALSQENALSVVAESSMTNIRHDRLRLVEPLVNGQIIICDAPEFTGATLGVFQGMSHG